jgi:hypothetical protein
MKSFVAVVWLRMLFWSKETYCWSPVVEPYVRRASMVFALCHHQNGWGRSARPGFGYDDRRDAARLLAALRRAAGAGGSEAACAAAVEAAI